MGLSPFSGCALPLPQLPAKQMQKSFLVKAKILFRFPLVKENILL